MRPFSKAFGALALATSLCSCAEYIDRRDTISELGGNAVRGNAVVQMVDPWPKESANKNIAFNGAKMETAVERYRTNRVYQPRSMNTSATYNAQQDPAQQQNNTTPLGPTVMQSAAPTK
jgi:hypothetical protein